MAGRSGRTLVLAPTATLAQPRAWQNLHATYHHGRYDEVHCVGGGSLLLWLLACAGRAPRGRVVHLHGPIVLPTPDSCAAWLADDASEYVDEWEWRQQAVKLGVGGAAAPWLRPLLRTIAVGRSVELGVRAAHMQRRWERNGRLIHLPTPSREADEVYQALRRGKAFAIDACARGEAPPALLRCTETDCVVF